MYNVVLEAWLGCRIIRPTHLETQFPYISRFIAKPFSYCWTLWECNSKQCPCHLLGVIDSSKHTLRVDFMFRNMKNDRHVSFKKVKLQYETARCL